jgi:hypothetical protein
VLAKLVPDAPQGRWVPTSMKVAAE